MESFFWEQIGEYGDKIALLEEDKNVTYAKLNEVAQNISSNIPSRAIVFCICSNCVGAVCGYIGFLQKKVVPIMLNHMIDREFFDSLFEIYKPQYIWCPESFNNDKAIYQYETYKLVKYKHQMVNVNDELAIMMTTSGSTGSPKFVKQSYKNIQKNTEAIVNYLEIKSEDRAITTLPMSYTYGLSIIQSHLMAGASLILTEQSFFDRGFWNYLKETKATTFGAVPYTYQMLDKLRFLQMDIPSLRYITQAGGRLGEELHSKFAKGMREKGKALIVMYGATEATARMSYVPKEYSIAKAGSIGIPIPGGRFELIDTDGTVINEVDKVGELIYYGENVSLGYAESVEDLMKPNERNGRLETGDMAKRDIDGFYYVVGRKKRFLKIFGNRINLAEVEELFSKAGYETACVGRDDFMTIFTTSEDSFEMVDYISKKTGINKVAFSVRNIKEIPHNEAGKVLYSELQKIMESE